MKIGLLTFHDTNNFGSYLQTFGLYKTVNDIGYDCEIIDYQCKEIKAREQYGTYNASLNPKEILKDILFNRVLRKKYRNLQSWLSSHAKIGHSYDKQNIKDSYSTYDKFLVGSDIVWGMDIIDRDTTYFLDFFKDKKKKIAFASSIGNPWSDNDKIILAPLLNDFNRIAVREEESADWVQELTHMRPCVVCDPTMLLQSNTWAKYKSEKYVSEKYVLVYFQTQQNLIDAKRIAKAKGLKCYVINYGLPIKGFKSVSPTNMADFLSLFYYASFVCTGSYHGMLFSIYFNREFAYFNRAHKSRMNTLAEKLGVQDREGTKYDVLSMKLIDYNAVNAKACAYREFSINCLKEMLSI